MPKPEERLLDRARRLDAALPSARLSVTGTAGAEYPSAARAWYTVSILLIAYIFSFADRQILALLVAPVRRDLGISDTQMSLLIGFSFALFYTTLGLPFGRLADRVNRPRLVAAGVFLWSFMTGGCGLVHSFWLLFLLRMGVGVGEASLSPAAYSVISDSFPPAKRAMPLSVYTMAIYVGSGCAFLFGALLLRGLTALQMLQLPAVGPTRPWQALFLVLGISGIVFALALFTLRDPSRKDARVSVTERGRLAVERIPLRSVIAYLLQNRATFLCLNLGMAMQALTGYAATSWDITFLTRTHHLSAPQAGILVGWAQILPGVLGMLTAGKAVLWLARRGYRDAYLRVALIAAIMWFLPGVLYPIVSTANASVALIFVAAFFRCMPLFLVPAAILELVPNAMRGQATALYLLVINAIGLGFGPTAVALVTDRLFGYDAALRYSLLIVPTLAYVLVLIFFWRGLKSYTGTLDRLQIWLKENV
jgi:MFS family permease